MILRRLTKHVKDQNWFAVGLDFVIVVIGVGVALMGQQVLSDRQSRADLRVAEAGLEGDLFRIYHFAKERLAVSECRVGAYRAVAAQLLSPGEDWVGMPRPEGDTDNLLKTALPVLLRSPSRNWGSQNWEAGLARGTFNQMPDERRTLLDGLFEQTGRAGQLQSDIFTLQGRIKTLAVSATISPSDRLRYYDMLSELDDKSAILEIIASQIIQQIEQVSTSISSENMLAVQLSLSQLSERGAAVYGECYVPMTFPLLEADAGEEEPE
ncbi:MAG: hypothetical protein KJ587_06380 [Alphaproteobacteria bacterium]|nr:hypothetical protein [Alphaproteobacteria bacterium]